jgi:uncharacterized repeat protein (TIGR02543 family)/LPXTG-motif cell wall-anchored protein
VSYNVNGAVSPIPPSESLYQYDMITRPTDPVRPGYEFVGWQLSNGIIWDFNVMSMPAQDIVLTAIWEEQNILIDFNGNGGPFTMPLSIITQVGTTILTPIIESIDNFIFYGFSYNPEPTTDVVDFESTQFYEDVTLYAQFDELDDSGNENLETPPPENPTPAPTPVPEPEVTPEPVSPVPVEKVENKPAPTSTKSLANTGDNNKELFLTGVVLIVISMFSIVKRKF